MACGWDCSARDAAYAAYADAQAKYVEAVERYNNALDLSNQLAEERGKLTDLDTHFGATGAAIEAAGTSIWSEANQATFTRATDCLKNYGEALTTAEDAAKTELDAATTEMQEAEVARDNAKAKAESTPCVYNPCPDTTTGGAQA